MQFQQYDLGFVQQGSAAEVVLSGNAANVLLLDSNNLNNYRAGRQFRYFGGYVKSSPVRIPIPSSGNWHVVIDLGGMHGSVRTSVKLVN